MTALQLSRQDMPKGIKRDWEMNPITVPSALLFLGGWPKPDEIEAAWAWFSQDDQVRVVVAVTSTGKRITARSNGRGRSITIATSKAEGR